MSESLAHPGEYDPDNEDTPVFQFYGHDGRDLVTVRNFCTKVLHEI